MSIKQLFICEKPSQARDIARILGCQERGDGFLANANITVSWCFGHLLELAGPAHYCENLKPWRMEILPIIPAEWGMEVKSASKKQFTILKKLLKESETVVIATDADREGELIAREILTLCKFNGPVKRLWLSALDDTSIKKALSEIRDGKTTESLYYAGLGRQRADWLMGMNMTMATSALFSKYGDGVLSVGRVQTPTLKLIVDRDQSIENFKSKDYFELMAQFTTQNNQSFHAKWQPPASACDEEGYCLDKMIVMACAAKVKGKPGTIENFEDKQKSQSAPLCFSLSQLQKLASSRYGLSAQKTLDIAQSLYETHKATTYPRTDCGYLPESQFSENNIILKNLKKINASLAELIDACDFNFKSPTWNDKKITAHHGMIPTLNEHIDVSNMSEDERKIYDLICRYYVAQFLGDYEYTQRSVKVLCEGESFKATNHTPLKPGWKRALTNIAENDSGSEEDRLSIIPLLDQNEHVKQTDEKVLTKQTKPPGRFTEGTLIEAMKSIGRTVQSEKHKKILKETAGIGTEATRANIIETLFKRSYIEKKGKQIFSTDKGRHLITLLPTTICDPVLTAEMEQDLDFVSQGQLPLESFFNRLKELLQHMLGSLQQIAPKQASHTTEQTYTCEKCKQSLIRRRNKKTGNYFWACSKFPECRFMTEDINGKPKISK